MKKANEILADVFRQGVAARQKGVPLDACEGLARPELEAAWKRGWMAEDAAQRSIEGGGGKPIGLMPTRKSFDRLAVNHPRYGWRIRLYGTAFVKVFILPPMREKEADWRLAVLPC